MTGPSVCYWFTVFTSRSGTGIKWVNPTLRSIQDLDDISPIGRLYEVYITYPQHLHKFGNIFLLRPNDNIPPASKVQTLMAIFERKEQYVIYYRTGSARKDKGTGPHIRG